MSKQVVAFDVDLLGFELALRKQVLAEKVPYLESLPPIIGVAGRDEMGLRTVPGIGNQHIPGTDFLSSLVKCGRIQDIGYMDDHLYMRIVLFD